MEFSFSALVPSIFSIYILSSYLAYLALAGAILPGKLVPGALLSDGSRLHYRCNGLASLLTLLLLLSLAVGADLVSAALIADRGLELFSLTLCVSILVASALYISGRASRDGSASLKPHLTGSLVRDWWLGIQLNPRFLGLDLKFFFVRAGMMGWFLINLSILAKTVSLRRLDPSVVLYQLFCGLYVLDYFFFEEYMTSTWDIIAERLGFMLVFGDLVFIPFTFSIQGWWLLGNEVVLGKPLAVVCCAAFAIGYTVFRGANRQKHLFKKDPKALIWGSPPKLVGGKLLVSGYWGIARHCNYLGDILLALSFSLPCGFGSMIPYFYPAYLFILLIWRERRDEARCSQKYKEVWVEYCRLVPWRIFPYIY